MEKTDKIPQESVKSINVKCRNLAILKFLFTMSTVRRFQTTAQTIAPYHRRMAHRPQLPPKPQEYANERSRFGETLSKPHNALFFQPEHTGNLNDMARIEFRIRPRRYFETQFLSCQPHPRVAEKMLGNPHNATVNSKLQPAFRERDIQRDIEEDEVGK